MARPIPESCTSFEDHRRVASGPLLANVLAIRRAIDAGCTGTMLIFDDSTGHTLDVDMRGTEAEIITRFSATVLTEAGDITTEAPRGPGRPKLGVVAREVTLLPRHWEWLAKQPGGASVALRRLVEEARLTNVDKDRARAAQERAYHFMLAIAGDLPGFEEASRALFANDRERFGELIANWPNDVQDHAMRLARADEAAVAPLLE